MSHTTIYFITEAEDLDQAGSRVTGYLETEHFFDCFSVLPETSGPLAQKRGELAEFAKDWDWKKSAESFLERAEKNKASGDLCSCGYDLIKAGELYAQCLTVETYVFNIEEGSYSVPTESKGWWAIAVDFHF